MNTKLTIEITEDNLEITLDRSDDQDANRIAESIVNAVEVALKAVDIFHKDEDKPTIH